MATRIQFRRGTEADWTSANPVLAEGELGLELDTGRFKVGVGTTSWTNLQYSFENIDELNVTGIGTVGSLSIGSTQVISSARQLQNIVSLDAITTATIESAVAAAPNDFTSLNIIGISTLNGLVDINNDVDISGNLKVVGISTLNNVVVGGATTALIVSGNARIIGILTIGTSSITLNGFNNQVNVGSATTITADGFQVGENTLYSTGLTVNNINSTGIITANSFSGTVTGTATSTTNIPNLTGDITSVNTATTLATVNSNVGSFGSQTLIPVVTVNAKGLVTAVTTAAVGSGLTVTGDSGSENIDLLSETLTISGGTNLTSSAASNTVTVNLDNNISLTSVVASGVITATSGFSGNVTGNVTGNLTGNINSSGVSTVTSLNATNINASGIVTATSGFVGNLTGTASTTTNIPNLTGAITSVNTTTSLGSFSSSNLATALTDKTGTGVAVFATSPTLVTPVLGNATATSVNVSGISTLGVTSTTNLTSQQLNVSGITTLGVTSVSSLIGYSALVGTASSTTTTFVVTVASKTSNHRYFGAGSANAYFIDGIESPFLTLLPGKTYLFNQDDGSNGGHQLLFYYQADKTTLYSTNVSIDGTPGSPGAYTVIVVTDITPVVLHYQCSDHDYMGNAAHFSSNVVDTPYEITARSGISVTGAVTATSFVGALTGTASTTTNIPNLTGAITSDNTTTSLGSFSSSNLSTALSDKTGTGVNVFATSPTLVTPSLGIATATNLTSQELNVSGIATLGAVKISSGIITSSNPGVSTVVYYGDGSNLQGVNAFNVINQDIISSPVFPTFASNTGVSSVGISTTKLVFVPASGNLGLGTTNPTSKLHVVGNGLFTGVVTATSFSGTASTTTNIPNLTGAITSVNTTTSLGSFSSSDLSTALTDETGSGSAVFATSPTLVTPVLGAASATSIVVSSGSTFTNGPILVGSATSTGTASQRLQVTGGAYVSGNLGIGVTAPSFKADIAGDARVTSTNKMRFGGTTGSTNFYIQYNSTTNSLDFVAG